MFRALLIFALVVLIAVAVLPEIIPALTWVLAFFSLLILGDLALGQLRKLRLRAAGRHSGRIESTSPSPGAQRDG